MQIKQHFFTKERARAFAVAGVLLTLYYPWMDQPFNIITLVTAGINLFLALFIWLKLDLTNRNLLKD